MKYKNSSRFHQDSDSGYDTIRCGFLMRRSAANPPVLAAPWRAIKFRCGITYSLLISAIGITEVWWYNILTRRVKWCERHVHGLCIDDTLRILHFGLRYYGCTCDAVQYIKGFISKWNKLHDGIRTNRWLISIHGDEVFKKIRKPIAIPGIFHFW